MIKTYDQFINENDAPRKYGCLMLQFDKNDWKEEIESMVDSDDLYTEDGYGFELEPHCTILYGFHDDDFSLDECLKNLVPVSEIQISCDNISLFKNENYDVLKYDIESEQLNELNERFTDKFKYTNDFPDYHAHCTIAYLKPGTGEKYMKSVERFFVPTEYRYSYGSGDNVYIHKAEKE